MPNRHTAFAFCLAACIAVPATASAHFMIMAPPSPSPWMTQDSVGSPQKMGPCGNEGGGTATNAVTTFQAGQTISLQWREVVTHDGWYRIAIVNDRNQLMDPPVVMDNAGNSADAGIENPVIAPVVADGLFPHNASDITNTKVWSYMLTLPQTACAKCTIQVLQFMNHHGSNLGNFPDGGINPDGYFYHHCMDISIAAEPAVDGGGEVPADAAKPEGADATLDGAPTEGAIPDASVSTEDSGVERGSSSSSSGSDMSTSGSSGSSSGAVGGSSGGSSSGAASSSGGALPGSSMDGEDAGGSMMSAHGGCAFVATRDRKGAMGTIGLGLLMLAGLRRRKRR
jgi:hypothetical protein